MDRKGPPSCGVRVYATPLIGGTLKLILKHGGFMSDDTKARVISIMREIQNLEDELDPLLQDMDEETYSSLITMVIDRYTLLEGQS